MLSFEIKNTENAFTYTLIQHSPRSDAERRCKEGSCGQKIAENMLLNCLLAMLVFSQTPRVFAAREKRQEDGENK